MSMPAHSTTWRVVPAVVMATTVLFILGFEVINGSLPGSRLPAKLTRADWLEGRATKLIEEGASKDTAFAKFIRPYYLEVAWKLAGIVTPAVAMGKAQWLFLPEVVRRYPRSAPEPLIERHATAIANLSGWLHGQGIKFLVVPVPNKETMATAYLPNERDPGRPQYPAIVEALKRHGVPHVDAAPELTLELPESWHPNDTHWGHLGTQRVAELVASRVAPMFPDGIPGVATDMSFVRKQGHSFQGDIQRLMGFRNGSWVDREWNARVTRVTALRAVDRKPPLQKGSPIVVAGTSFTHSTQFGPKVGAAMKRNVDDVSRPGVGPVVGLLELLDQVEQGKRSRPDLVIWEFPERQVFLRMSEFLNPLEEWVARHEPYFSKGEIPLGPPQAMGGFARATSENDATVVGMSVTRDPWISWTLDHPVDSDGSYALHFDLTVDVPIHIKVYLDCGDGFLEQTTIVRTSVKSGSITLPMRISPNRRIRQLRLDPGNEGQSFQLKRVALWKRGT